MLFGLYKRFKFLITTALICGFMPSAVSAQADSAAVAVDSVAVTADSVAIAADSVAVDSVPVEKPHRNIVQKVIDYFSKTNEDRSDKKFDISFIGGPNYSESTSFQIAGLVSGLYKSRHDSLTPRSDVSVYAQASVTGFYNFGIKGNHIFPDDKMRIVYDANFCHFPLKFWGIGYDQEIQKANESEYTELLSAMNIQWLFKLPHDIFIGPSADFNYSKATKVDRPELWDGQEMRIFNYGMGITLSVDTRDLPTNPYSGYYVGVNQKFFPAFMGNDYAFSMTEASAMYYKRFWASGVMAFRIHGAFTYGDTPWCMLPTLDNGNAVRGYYEGRYRDKNEMDAIVEVRQHVWRRNGVVAWAGVGTVFRQFNDIQFRKLLPTFGIGYRWEFKKRVNVRVDFGLGKHSHSIAFGINEAF